MGSPGAAAPLSRDLPPRVPPPKPRGRHFFALIPHGVTGAVIPSQRLSSDINHGRNVTEVCCSEHKTEFPPIVSLHIGLFFSTARGDHFSSKPVDAPPPAPLPHPAMTDCSHTNGFYAAPPPHGRSAQAPGLHSTRLPSLPSTADTGTQTLRAAQISAWTALCAHVLS